MIRREIKESKRERKKKSERELLHELIYTKKDTNWYTRIII